MKDNQSAFDSREYDEKIRQTLPYYDEFYKQVVELVKVCKPTGLNWLDVGCGTGKMAESALSADIEINKFVFCDCSDEMLKTAKKRYSYPNADFVKCRAQDLTYEDAFDVVTAIQVNHYLQNEERKIAVKKYYNALKNGGLFISFENFAPFSEFGEKIYLDRWKQYQIRQGKSAAESEAHILRYGKEYFPISLTEHLNILRGCGFKTAEILWVSNMQAGIWGIKQ